MLVNEKVRMIKTPFDNEAEIEGVVMKYSELLFGSSIIYLPKSKITTIGGKGTIPDGFVIDVQSEEWFIVEAERAVHGTWEHIAPQISKQLAAVATPATRELILQLALNQLKSNKALREIFAEIGINELEIHGKLQNILRKPPTIALPIDAIPSDLKAWIQTLRTEVKIWLIEKFVDSNDPKNIIYSLPDEITPTLISKPGKGNEQSTIRTISSQPFQEVLEAGLLKEGQILQLEYGQRGKPRQSFKGVVRKDGIEVDGKVSSPSYSAIYCIQKTGSKRPTANGWVMWKTEDGKLIDSLYDELKSQP